ncbi:MAG: amidohydrolase family protein [Chitinophagaceae bacterium]
MQPKLLPLLLKQTARFLLLPVYMFVAIVTIAQQTTNTDATIIYHVNIIDVNTGSVTTNDAILIEKNIIKAIGSYSSLHAKNKKAKTVDAIGRYAIPGLWDMHVHIEGENLVEDNLALFPVYIAYGITTVRDCASDLGIQVLKWRDEINKGKLFGPRIFTAGRKLEGINSIWKGDMEIANEQDLKLMLDTLVNYKVDFIKITENTLAGDLFLKSVIASKKLGFKVSGHVPIDLSIKDLADAGFSSIEHASYLIRLGSDEQKTISDLKSGNLSRADANRLYYTNFNQDKAIEGYKMLAQKNVAICPTLIGGKQLSYLDVDDHHTDEYQQYLTKRFMASYNWRIKRQAGDTKEQIQQRKENYELIVKQIPYIQASGMRILAGTDAAALNSFIYPGLALHQELEIFQKAGMKPLDVLQSATINGAKFMGVYDSLASITPGKIADIVLLNKNPLHDITATQDIFGVIKNGVYFDRRALDKLLEEAAQKKIDLDVARKEQ